jgi:hypothetical protein
MKDYRTVSPNTGTISKKLLECGFLGHLVGSVDLGNSAKEKWRQRNRPNHGKIGALDVATRALQTEQTAHPPRRARSAVVRGYAGDTPATCERCLAHPIASVDFPFATEMENDKTTT